MFVSNLANYYGGLQPNTGTFRSPGEIWNDLSGVTANNQFSSIEAAKNREWQEYMASTAHQREVEDLRSAGLNPALATGMGGNVSSPSGGSASASSGSRFNVVNAAAKIASTAILGAYQQKVAQTAKYSNVHHYDMVKLAEMVGDDYRDFSSAMSRQRYDDSGISEDEIRLAKTKWI